MPRGFSNYSFVIDSNFQPFTMQEMLTPFVMYKDAFDQAEAAYTDLSDKADTFKYLSDTLPEGSRAKEIYDGYANYLHEQAQDFAKHGLNMGNRRALTDLKRRYQGEIGRLSKADEALRQERELRRKLAAQDSSILYADDNLTIDSFLDNETPNLYSISGNELYTKGAAAGKAASSRVYGAEDAGSTLGGYYRDYVQRMGYTPEQLRQFGSQISADFSNWAATNIPDLGLAANQILEANGVSENLTGNNLRRAQQQVIRGIIDGAVYTESHNPTRDLGKMTASEQAAESRAERQYREITKPTFDMQKQAYEDERKLKYKFDAKGNVIGLNPDYVNNNNNKTPEQKAIEEMQKKEVLDRMQKAQKMKTVKTVEEAAKVGYEPALATVHPSHGSSSGLSVQEARKQNKYGNIDGWRSGFQGTDVPNLYIDWTSAPLVEGSNKGFMPDLFQWTSGSEGSPNNGDFSYNIKGSETRVLSDQEYNSLPEAVRMSIEKNMSERYPDDTPYEVMEVTRKGKTSYLTFVPQGTQRKGE